MKLSQVVTLLVTGLFVVGSVFVARHRTAVGVADRQVNPFVRMIADGQPPPPPKKPYAVLTQPGSQKTPWLTADGNPPPPPKKTPLPISPIRKYSA